MCIRLAKVISPVSYSVNLLVNISEERAAGGRCREKEKGRREDYKHYSPK